MNGADVTKEQYEALFLEMNPGFFEKDYVRAVPENEPASEMLLCLKDFDEESYVKSFGDEVTFTTPMKSPGTRNSDIRRLSDGTAKDFADRQT